MSKAADAAPVTTNAAAAAAAAAATEKYAMRNAKLNSPRKQKSSSAYPSLSHTLSLPPPSVEKGIVAGLLAWVVLR